MQVQLSYEEQLMNAFYQNPQKRGEHFMNHSQRLHKILRGILQPLYDELDELREAKPPTQTNRSSDPEED